MTSLIVMMRPEDVPDAAVIQDMVRQIEAVPAVRRLSQLPASSKTRAGSQATLWCHAGRSHGGCGKWQEPAVQMSR